jgi:hypothetical protein
MGCAKSKPATVISNEYLIENDRQSQKIMQSSSGEHVIT